MEKYSSCGNEKNTLAFTLQECSFLQIFSSSVLISKKQHIPRLFPYRIRLPIWT